MDVVSTLLARFGIESRLVSVVDSTSGIGYGWNAVKIGGSWYRLDTSVNDSTGQVTKYLLRTESERLQQVKDIQTLTDASSHFKQSLHKGVKWWDVDKGNYIELLCIVI